MFKNYLTVAIRNLARHKVYSFINISGLAVGMASCLLIGLYIYDELNYDNFKNADRIYRVLRENHSGDQRSIKFISSGALQQVLEDEFPEVETATRLAIGGAGYIQYGNKAFSEVFGLTEPDFYDIFDIPFIKGSREDVRQQPMSIVLSKRLADQLFDDEDPIGKVVTMTRKAYFNGELVVRGIMDNISQNTSFPCDMLITGFKGQPVQKPNSSGEIWWDNWRPIGSYAPIITCVLLKQDVNAKALEAKLQGVIGQYMGSEAAKSLRYHLQPWPRIHLYSKMDYNMPQGFWRRDIQDIYLLCAVAGFILLIACINFINLTTARSARRAQEVGLRKVVGAHRFQMVAQFMGEAILMVGISLIIALGLIELLLPHFAALVTKPHLSLGALNVVLVVFGLCGLVLVVTLLSGAYPAFFLSAFNPAETLKGASHTGVRGEWLRKGLVVAQFTLSIALIAGTTIVYQQMAFIRSKRNMGNEHIILTTNFFRMDSRSTANRDAWLVNRYWTIKDEILKHPNISDATASIWLKGSGGSLNAGISVEGREDEIVQVSRWNVDEDFIPFYNLKIVTGRNFSREISTDETQSYILNESAVKVLGLTDPIGKTVTWNKRPGQVIGVVKDYHFGSLHHQINPQILIMGKSDFNYFTLKIHPENLSKTIAFVKATLLQFSSKPLPVTYWFEDDFFQLTYRQDIQTGNLVTTFSGLAIFLACLGLLGLAAYAAERRTKEIGVRKVLGASVGGIMALLSKDFVKLVLIANLIAWPVAYYTANHWLQAFAYRIDVGILPFLLSAALTLLIALGTVSYQAWKAARANPIDALRYE